VKRAWFLVGLLALGCLFSPSACPLFGIIEEPAPERDFEMEDLVIDVSSFPQGWYAWAGPYRIPDSERGEEESVYVQFHHAEVPTDVVGAGQRVFRYANERSSGVGFAGVVRDHFHSSFMATPWAVPDDWTYHSGVADEFEFACGEIALRRQYWRCQAVGQYDEYVSFLYAELHPEYMTLDDVERLVAAVDDQMALYLEKGAR
jgi:hypothetical protein